MCFAENKVRRNALHSQSLYNSVTKRRYLAKFMSNMHWDVLIIHTNFHIKTFSDYIEIGHKPGNLHSMKFSKLSLTLKNSSYILALQTIGFDFVVGYFPTVGIVFCWKTTIYLLSSYLDSRFFRFMSFSFSFTEVY